MIFMWFLARSSRGTGPKMRVPIGSFWLFTSTAAFLSKRITEPSGRWMSLAAHDDRLHDVALLHPPARDRLLDGHDDDVAHRGVLALRAAQHLDAHHAPRARVVGDVEVRLHLDHGLDPFRRVRPVSGGAGRSLMGISRPLPLSNPCQSPDVAPGTPGAARRRDQGPCPLRRGSRPYTPDGRATQPSFESPTSDLTLSTRLGALSSRTSAQVFSFEYGRDSSIVTMSPTLAALPSSCAW